MPLQIRLWHIKVMLGVVLAKIQETQGEAIEGQQYNHDSSSTKTITNFFSSITLSH